MSVRTFALIYGLVFTVVGIAGFIPALVTPHTGVEHALTFEEGAGDLFGLFPVNLLHNLVHLAFGVWGLAASRLTHESLVYARAVAIVYALLVIMGLIPNLDTVAGFVPIHGNDVWLHAVLAVGAAYFGFMHLAELDRTNTPAARGA